MEEEEEIDNKIRDSINKKNHKKPTIKKEVKDHQMIYQSLRKINLKKMKISLLLSNKSKRGRSIDRPQGLIKKNQRGKTSLEREIEAPKISNNNPHSKKRKVEVGQRHLVVVVKEKSML